MDETQSASGRDERYEGDERDEREEDDVVADQESDQEAGQDVFVDTILEEGNSPASAMLPAYVTEGQNGGDGTGSGAGTSCCCSASAAASQDSTPGPPPLPLPGAETEGEEPNNDDEDGDPAVVEVDQPRQEFGSGTPISVPLAELCALSAPLPSRAERPRRDVGDSVGAASGAAEAAFDNPDTAAVERALSRTIAQSDFREMEIVGQFNHAFIIVRRCVSPREEDLFIVDQHAADEKANFERLTRTAHVRSQALLVYVAWSLDVLFLLSGPFGSVYIRRFLRCCQERPG